MEDFFFLNCGPCPLTLPSPPCEPLSFDLVPHPPVQLAQFACQNKKANTHTLQKVEKKG